MGYGTLASELLDIGEEARGERRKVKGDEAMRREIKGDEARGERLKARGEG